MELILASQSPRRRELLEKIGVPFDIVVSECDETLPPDTPADQRRNDIQPGSEHRKGQGEDHSCLRAEQIDIRFFGVRQRILSKRRRAGNRIHVMGGDNPGGLFAEAPDPVHDFIQGGVFI